MKLHAWQVCGLWIALCLTTIFVLHAAEPQPSSLRQLSEFGDVGPKQLAETFHNAIAELRKSGGVLSLTQEQWKQLQSKQESLQGLSRSPEPPAETKRWTMEPGVTIVAHDGKSVIVQVPPLSGLRIERPIRLADGDSLPHWGTHPAITLDSQIIAGSSSYLDYLQALVAKGKDQRFPASPRTSTTSPNVTNKNQRGTTSSS